MAVKEGAAHDIQRLKLELYHAAQENERLSTKAEQAAKRAKELLELGQAVAREILKDSSYGGDYARYWNGHERASRLALFAEGNLEELRRRSANNGDGV